MLRSLILTLIVLLMPTAGMAARPAAPAAAAQPRALTSAQLSDMGLLGRFQGLDPDLYGRIWRVGRDPRTCAEALYLQLIFRSGLQNLRHQIDLDWTNGSGIDQQIINNEIAIVDLLEFTGRYSDAERYLNQRIALRRPNDTPSDANERQLLLRRRLGQLYTDTRPVEAERLLKAVLAVRVASIKQTAAEQSHGYAAGSPAVLYQQKFAERTITSLAQDHLASFYRQTGRPEEALRLYQAALGPAEREGREITNQNIGQPADIQVFKSAIAVTRAEIAEKAGRMAEAEALYRDCCSTSAAYARLLLREGKRDMARIVLSRMMVDIAADLEDVFDCMQKPAESDLNTAAKWAQENANQTFSSSHGVDMNLYTARLIKASRDLGRATELGELLIEDGLAYDAQGILLPTYGLQAITLGSDHPDTIRSLAALARAVRIQGRPRNAIDIWAEWQSAGTTFLRDRLWSVNEDARRSFFRDDRRNVDSYLAALREAQPADAATRALALTLGHKGMLASVAGDITARARTRTEPKIAALLAQLKQQRTTFAALALHDKGDTAEARLVRRNVDELEAQLVAALGTTPNANAVPTQQALLAALKPGDALVDFLVFADPDTGDGPGRYRMVAVIARAGAAPELVWWADAAVVRAAAERFRNAILSSAANPEAELDAAGRALNDVLWKPVATHLGGVTRVLLGPDDVLNVVPLAAMPDEQGRPLVERYEMMTLAAPRDLLASGAPGKGSTTALVLGAPAFGAMPGSAATRAVGRVIAKRGTELYFVPLPGTENESRGVNALLAKSYTTRVLDGATATKAAVMAARSPAIMHLATHGFFLSGGGDDPLVSLSRSGLALANANAGIRATQPGDTADGILTALEAVSLDLRGTKMVVLSACETGLGEIASGEGVYGLAQALHQAGAQSVLATLWPVSDEGTAAFMQLFYARIAAGDEPQKALRSTQLAFIHGDKWKDPIFWAPFVLTGRN